MALYEESKDKWFGLLQKAKEEFIESEFYDKCLKNFKRLHHNFDLENGRKGKLRAFSRLVFNVFFYLLIYFFRIMNFRYNLKSFLILLVVIKRVMN